MASSEDPLGPKTVKESFKWAPLFLERLFNHFGRTKVIQRLRKWRWEVGTVFSGIGCAEAALTSLEAAVQQSLRKGDGDIKYKVHEKYYSDLESADVHIIENVTEYQLERYFNLYFNPDGSTGPRVFGVMWKTAYIGLWNPNFEFVEVLNSLRESNLQDYMDPSKFKRTDWEVADLNQRVAANRGRSECKDGSLMCVTTNSGRLYNKALQRVMHPLELLATHSLPVDAKQSAISKSPKLELSSTSKTAQIRMAGNAMSVPTMGAIIVATILGLS
ncbi:unnamed protein product [Durusdinium trenchii]|uniref:Uncharacterized protein n=1 Tax=Durusdinium trenchii TaxID=1381693 RepID=A0ABP0P9V0_9DINO